MRVHADPHHLVGPSFAPRENEPPQLVTFTDMWTSLASHQGSNHCLMVSPVVFVCCWGFIAVMHFFNGTLALVFSIFYLFFSLPSVYPTIAVIELSLTVLKISGWAYMLIAVVHWVALLRMFWLSVQARTLTFSSSRILARSKHHEAPSFSGKLRTMYHHLWRPWNLSFGVEGVFGVNGRYFYVAFIAREVIEIGLQTYQAYQLSGSVRRSWITNLLVGVIVVNSISTPLVDVIFRRHQESARRFMSILVDMSLDFCCAALIPLCVVYPYIATYDISKGSMPLSLTNDDVWFTASMIEIRQFCVTSTVDFLATMMPHVTVYTCLRVAQKLVRRDLQTSATPGAAKPKRMSMAIVVSPESLTVESSHRSPQLSHAIVHSVTGHRLHNAFHFLVVLWSVFILMIHIRASSHATASTVQGCRLSINAWFASGAPCSVMQINCYKLQLEGLSDDIATILHPLDRAVLHKLIIIHCPSLEIPRVLGEFSELTDLEVYNSTLISWPREAAATRSTMKSLVNFYWLCSPYITFPAGLLHSNLPDGFSRFSIARSNATKLPDDLGSLWAHRSLDVFSLESTDIDHLPSTFSDLRVRKVRLISNPIEHIQNNAFATKRMTALLVSGSPLKEWPASLGDTTVLMQLEAEYTNISNLTVPVLEWWNQQPTGLFSRHSFSLYGSPICDNNITTPYCAQDHDTRQGTYEWDLIEPQRSLDK